MGGAQPSPPKFKLNSQQKCRNILEIIAVELIICSSSSPPNLQELPPPRLVKCKFTSPPTCKMQVYNCKSKSSVQQITDRPTTTLEIKKNKTKIRCYHVLLKNANNLITILLLINQTRNRKKKLRDAKKVNLKPFFPIMLSLFESCDAFEVNQPIFLEEE